jgi:hypothetical protein
MGKQTKVQCCICKRFMFRQRMVAWRRELEGDVMCDTCSDEIEHCGCRNFPNCDDYGCGEY